MHTCSQNTQSPPPQPHRHDLFSPPPSSSSTVRSPLPADLQLDHQSHSQHTPSESSDAGCSVATSESASLDDPPRLFKRSSSFLSAFRTSCKPVDPRRFDIAMYLTRVSSNSGRCQGCAKVVPWARDRVISHKRAGCPRATVEEQSFFRSQNAMRKGIAVTSGAPPAKLQRLHSHQPSTKHWVDSVSVAEAESISNALANVFFRTGLSFNIVDSAAMRDFIAAIRPAYSPYVPSAKQLSGARLNAVYERLKTQLRSWIDGAFCYSLVSDGWSNSSNVHFVNYIVIIPGKPPFFFKSMCTSGIPQTGDVVASEILKVIHELGPSKCVSVITDNASSMRKAWDLIESALPHVSANGCGAHVMNLLIKDLCDIGSIKHVIEKMVFVIRFVRERQHILAYVEEQRGRLGIKHKLVLPAATRWYTHFNACSHLMAARFAVLSLVDDNETANAVMAATKNQDSVRQFKSTVEDPIFWKSLNQLRALIELPTMLIGKLERDDCDVSSVYHYFMKLYTHYGSENKVLREMLDISTLTEAQELTKARWEFVHTASMGFAYMLSPRFCNSQWLDDDKVDTQIQFAKFVAHIFKDDKSTCDECMSELRAFLMLEVTSSPDHFALYSRMTGLEYWVQHGTPRFPVLATIAKRIFTIPTSSAAAERAWSAFSFLWSKRRNRLRPEKVERLAFIYTNSALLDDKDNTDYFQQLISSEISDQDDTNNGERESFSS